MCTLNKLKPVFESSDDDIYSKLLNLFIRTLNINKKTQNVLIVCFNQTIIQNMSMLSYYQKYGYFKLGGA